MANFLKFFTLLATLFVLNSVSSYNIHKPIIVVIAYDGYAAYYIQKFPNYFQEELLNKTHQMCKNEIDPIFPTLRLPNLHSIATGQYPEVHGVVNDKVYVGGVEATEDDAHFWTSDKDVVPVWIYNQHYGAGKAFSGCINWPGCDLEYEIGNKKIMVDHHNHTEKNWQEKAVEMLTDKKKPVNLLFIHISEPYETAFATTVNSSSVKLKIEELGNDVEDFLAKLKEKKDGIEKKVNLILLGDHGVTAKGLKEINLKSLAKGKLEYVRHVIGNGAFLNVDVDPGKEVEFIQELLSDDHNIKASKTSDFKGPPYFYYNNDRIFNIIVHPPLGYYYTIDGYKDISADIRGYEVENNPNMRPFFLAYGPDFRDSGFHTNSISIVDVAYLIAGILDFEIKTGGKERRNERLERAGHLMNSKYYKKELDFLNYKYDTDNIIF